MEIAAAGRTIFSLLGSGPTNLQQTNALVWVMLGISVGGAIVTFGFLVYAVWKWRDREANRRPYG
jgi:heme/copper-type cytochrome/quinol oxidase subunit 2